MPNLFTCGRTNLFLRPTLDTLGWSSVPTYSFCQVSRTQYAYFMRLEIVAQLGALRVQSRGRAARPASSDGSRHLTIFLLCATNQWAGLDWQSFLSAAGRLLERCKLCPTGPFGRVEPYAQQPYSKSNAMQRAARHVPAVRREISNFRGNRKWGHLQTEPPTSHCMVKSGRSCLSGAHSVRGSLSACLITASVMSYTDSCCWSNQDWQDHTSWLLGLLGQESFRSEVPVTHKAAQLICSTIHRCEAHPSVGFCF